MKSYLSKSKYTAFRQCPKILCMNKNLTFEDLNDALILICYDT